MTASVSTIVPCYRCSKTIGRALDSIANQTVRPAEVILVDDGSGDDTLETLLELQRDYGKDWVEVIALEKNQGPAVARNAGWDAASHDYIAFLDSDDAWHPAKISVQYSWMLSHPEISLSGHLALAAKPEVPLNYEPIPGNISANLITRNQILLSNAFNTSSIMLKRALNHRFSPSLRYSQDYFLCLEIILAGLQTAVLNFPVTYYFKPRYGSSGQTKNLLNGKAAESEIYRRLWQAKHISFIEWRMLSLWSLAKYYRRVLICSLR